MFPQVCSAANSPGQRIFTTVCLKFLVGPVGFEPTRLAAARFKLAVSTVPTTALGSPARTRTSTKRVTTARATITQQGMEPNAGFEPASLRLQGA